MKGLNKMQIEVDEKAKVLPKPNAMLDRLVHANFFPNKGYANGKHITCLECGSTFESDKTNGKVVCPHCGKSLSIEKSKKQSYNEARYFLYSLRFKGWQVNRYFYVDKCCRKGREARIEIQEVMQKWVNAKGKLVVRAKNFRPMSPYRDAWNFDTEITTKRYTKNISDSYYTDKYDIYYHKCYTASMLPELKRNGFDGKDHNAMELAELQQRILTDSKVETIWKLGFYEFAKLGDLSRYWAEVKICIKNNYHAHDIGLWRDMICNLRELQKDTHNPFYICPNDLEAAHDRWVRKVDELRSRREIEQKRKDIQLQEVGYYNRMKAYLGIVIQNDTYVITPLQSVSDFYNEGKAMHHCVFTNNYYLIESSLIFSVKDKEGNRVSTIEFDLDEMKIIQNRAVFNSVPTDKDIIDKLVMSNLKQIAESKTVAMAAAQAA